MAEMGWRDVCWWQHAAVGLLLVLWGHAESAYPMPTGVVKMAQVLERGFWSDWCSLQ